MNEIFARLYITKNLYSTKSIDATATATINAISHSNFSIIFIFLLVFFVVVFISLIQAPLFAGVVRASLIWHPMFPAYQLTATATAAAAPGSGPVILLSFAAVS
jgi:hypothetical protein